MNSLQVTQVKQAPQFRTSDNQVHSSKKDAKMHEAGLALYSRFTTTYRTQHDDSPIKAACMAIAKNFGEFKSVFDAIKRIR